LIHDASNARYIRHFGCNGVLGIVAQPPKTERKPKCPYDNFVMLRRETFTTMSCEALRRA